MEIDSRPVEIDELQRAVDRLKMEEMALAREVERRGSERGTSERASATSHADEASKHRLERIRRDLADKQEQLNALIGRWEHEKAGLNRVGELKKRIDDLRGQAERAQRDGDLETSARLMYGEIPALEKELAQASEAAEDRDAMVKEEVGADDVAEVVSSWTGVPVGKLLEGETAKLLRMEDELGRRLIGQRAAVTAVSDAVRRARAPTRTGRPARSCSSAPPVSARRSWPRRSPSSCSTTSGRWSAST
jgi:ATP-dependent Clp protease ATP-binding subunit ClpB